MFGFDKGNDDDDEASLDLRARAFSALFAAYSRSVFDEIRKPDGKEDFVVLTDPDNDFGLTEKVLNVVTSPGIF